MFIFSRCTNDISTIFWYSFCFQTWNNHRGVSIPGYLWPSPKFKIFGWLVTQNKQYSKVYTQNLKFLEKYWNGTNLHDHHFMSLVIQRCTQTWFLKQLLMPCSSARAKYFLSWENAIFLGQKFLYELKKYIFACEMDGKWLFSHGNSNFYKTCISKSI